MGAYSPCDVCNSKHDVSHKSLALYRSLLLSIGPFSAPQAEYSASTYSIQDNRATAAVKLENTSNTINSIKGREKQSYTRNLKFRDRTAKT